MFRTMDTASKKKDRKVTGKAGSYFYAKVTAALKTPFQVFSLPTTFLTGRDLQMLVLLSATVAGSVDKLTCRNTNVTSVWLVAGVHCQPSDHVRGTEGQRGGATSISTHTRPGFLQRTCRAGSSPRVWPQSRSLHRSLRATSCQISYPWTPWSSLLHSGLDKDKIKLARILSYHRD